jgi:DNA-binding HxlR family transcriptional regulator
MQNVLEIVGRRWAGPLLIAGVTGARRFTEYRRHVPGITDRVLTRRLRELTSLDLLERQVIPSTPVQILYRPTGRGEQLVAALRPLAEWGEQHLV